MSDYKLPISYEDAELMNPGFNILDVDGKNIGFTENESAAKLIVDYVNGFAKQNEEIKKENGDQPKPEEEKKPVDYLTRSKDSYRAMNFQNSSYYQEANAAALIFIGEQLERIAKVVEYQWQPGLYTTSENGTVELFNDHG